MTPVWIALTIILLALLAALHIHWRGKYRALQGQQAAALEAAQRQQLQASAEAKNQQQVLFNSMLEGLLLLDRSHKIYLANRSFKELFGQKGELRGKTIVETLRLHELEALVTRLMEENDRLVASAAAALDSPHLESEHREMQPA